MLTYGHHGRSVSRCSERGKHLLEYSREGHPSPPGDEICHLKLQIRYHQHRHRHACVLVNQPVTPKSWEGSTARRRRHFMLHSTSSTHNIIIENVLPVFSMRCCCSSCYRVISRTTTTEESAIPDPAIAGAEKARRLRPSFVDRFSKPSHEQHACLSLFISIHLLSLPCIRVEKPPPLAPTPLIAQ
jgi:hypothetical protein